MRLRGGLTTAVIALAGLAVASAPAGSATGPPLRGEVIGHSLQGRALRLVRVGDPAAPRKVLVVGCIHGSERAGLAVTRALRHAFPPDGVQLLVLDTMNPDGCGAGTRGNARGVDLNRNFPWGWRSLQGIFYSGPRPSSEPETQAVEALDARERPDVSIWFHQHLDWVDLQRGSSASLMLRYARVTAMRAVRTAVLPGTVARWENHRLPGHSAFVVELPAGPLSVAGAAAQERAVLAVARAIAPRGAPTPGR
jgi:protein MpaA